MSSPGSSSRAVDDGPATTVPGAPLGAEDEGCHDAGSPLTTMQGTETTLDGPASRPRRARMARLAAIVACALVAAPVVVLGGRKLGGFGSSSAASDSLDGALEEARDCMRRRAWDAPPGHNFKEVTDGALTRWHDSAPLADLRREAAERLVNDALGRKYANDVPEAAHLVDLALHFDPDLTTAQHLSAELSASRAPDVAPATSSSATGDRGKHRGRDARATDSRPDPRGVQQATAAPPNPRQPPPPPPGPGGAVLPPPPAPHPPGDAPAAQSTGPWL